MTPDAIAECCAPYGHGSGHLAVWLEIQLLAQSFCTNKHVVMKVKITNEKIRIRLI